MEQINVRYEIKITNCNGKPGVWYSNKIGNTYTATRQIKPVERFKINDIQYVSSEHCDIIKSNGVPVLDGGVSKKSYISDEVKYKIIHLIKKNVERKVISKKFNLSIGRIRGIWKKYINDYYTQKSTQN